MVLAAPIATHLLQSLLAISIIYLPLLGIGQHLMGCIQGQRGRAAKGQ